jgi:hypothetical protein
MERLPRHFSEPPILVLVQFDQGPSPSFVLALFASLRIAEGFGMTIPQLHSERSEESTLMLKLRSDAKKQAVDFK